MGLLEGKVALITGAARGQGRSHAVGLAREGADIIAVDICGQVDTVTYPLASPEDLDETARRGAGPARATREADVRDADALSCAVRRGCSSSAAWTSWWPTPASGPCTSRSRATRPRGASLAGHDRHQPDRRVEHGRAGAPHLKASGGGGAIVLTSSTQGLKGAANDDISLTAYTAAKHGVVGLMRATAIDLAPHSIRVNTVHPTGVLTPMIENDVVPAYAEKHPRFAEITANLLPVDSSSQDITNAVLYLVADTGRYVTGVTLPVDAGYLESNRH